MEELDPSVVAAVDRVNASFLWLTKELMTLHVQANSALDDPDVVKTLMGIKVQLGLAMKKVLDSDEHPDIVFGYIMYLVDLLCVVREEKLLLGQKLNEIGNLVNESGAVLGMQALVGGGTVDHGLADESTYVTSSGQHLTNIHPGDTCHDWCVIHRPLPGPWDHWSVVWRGSDALDEWHGFQRVCPCGIGHTAMEEVLRDKGSSHDCCGLCPCGPPAATPIFNESGELEGYR
jgi:hypothetical protein